MVNTSKQIPAAASIKPKIQASEQTPDVVKTESSESHMLDISNMSALKSVLVNNSNANFSLQMVTCSLMQTCQIFIRCHLYVQNNYYYFV